MATGVEVKPPAHAPNNNTKSMVMDDENGNFESKHSMVMEDESVNVESKNSMVMDDEKGNAESKNVDSPSFHFSYSAKVRGCLQTCP